jgi:hypothetical protein
MPNEQQNPKSVVIKKIKSRIGVLRQELIDNPEICAGSRIPDGCLPSADEELAAALDSLVNFSFADGMQPIIITDIDGTITNARLKAAVTQLDAWEALVRDASFESASAIYAGLKTISSRSIASAWDPIDLLCRQGSDLSLCKALRSDIDTLQSYFLSAQNGFCAPWRSRTDLPLEGTRALLKFTRSFGAQVIVVSLRNAVDDLRPPLRTGATPPFIKLSSDFVLVSSPEITETGHRLCKLGLIEAQDCLLMYNGCKVINFSSDRQEHPGIDIEPSKAKAIEAFIERYPQYQPVIGLDNDPKQLQKMEHLVASTMLVLGDLPVGVNPKNIKRFPRMYAWDTSAVDRLERRNAAERPDRERLSSISVERSAAGCHYGAAESVNRPFGHKL